MRAEKILPQLILGRDDFVRRALVFRQLANQGKNGGDILALGEANPEISSGFHERLIRRDDPPSQRWTLRPP